MSSIHKRKRGERNESEYKVNKIKCARVHGEEYLNYKGKLVVKQTTGPPCK